MDADWVALGMTRGVEAVVMLAAREEEEGLWVRTVGEVGFCRAEGARKAAKKFAKKGRLMVGIVGKEVVVFGVFVSESMVAKVLLRLFYVPKTELNLWMKDFQ